MAINRAALSPDERAEYDALMSEALNGSRSADVAAVDRAEAALVSAEQAGRDWPSIIMRMAMREQLRVELKSIAKRESMVSVDYHGRIVAKTSRRGVSGRDDAGERYHQQKLIEDMTWQEFGEWVALNDAQIKGLEVNRHMALKLQTLRTSYPDSATVGDALAAAGVTLAEFMAEGAA